MFERLRRRPAHAALEFDSPSLLGLASVSPNLVVVAVDGQLAFANAAAERFVGEATSGGLLGRPVLDLIHADDRERASALLAQIRASGQAEVWSGVRLVALDGRAIDLEASLVPVSFDGKRAAMLNGRDDHEAQRALAALQESELRYQSLIAAAPVAIYRLDADGRCVYLNRRFTEMTGLSLEEARGRSWFDYVPEAAMPIAREMWRRLVEGPGTYSLEQSVRHLDGSKLRVFLQIVAEKDVDGKVTGWVGTFTDLRDLKETRNALARSEERLRLALQAASMVTWEFDVATGRVEWSENGDAVLGLPPGSLPSDIESAWALIPPSEVVFRNGSARESLALGEPFEVEARLRLPGIEPRWILGRGQAHPSGSPGRQRVVGVIADVTARHQIAEERALLEQKLADAQRLESLGLLAGGVAHDFNNLLVGILGNAELALARLSDDAPARELLLGIRHAGVRAGELVRQILAFSGSQPLSSQPVDLYELARETLELLRAALPREARVRVAAPERPAFVRGDPTQLRQVLMNLLVNACESLPEGRGEVSIAIAPSADDDDAAPRGLLALEVRDTGAGMDAQTRARIFDPFYSKRAGGRGLGLAVVHGIVRAHGGAIEVESEPGAGTRVRVLLPEIAEPAGVRAPSEDEDAGAPAAARSALILVVDDERAVREVMRVSLESAGHRVLLAGSAPEARALFAERGAELDAILLDLSLGSESSDRFLAEIRARTSELPVLVTSGYPEEEAIGRLSTLGVSAFVQKPFTPAQLNSALARSLSVRRSLADA